MEGVESVAVQTDLELGEVRSFECVFVGEVKSPTGTRIPIALGWALATAAKPRIATTINNVFFITFCINLLNY